MILTQVPKPIPALSYAVDKFFDETALWYDAICEILARHAHPNGRDRRRPGGQRDGLLLGVNAYSGDFSSASRTTTGSSWPASTDRWRDQQAHGSTLGRPSTELDPPRRFTRRVKEDIPCSRGLDRVPRALPHRQHEPPRRDDARTWARRTWPCSTTTRTRSAPVGRPAGSPRPSTSRSWRRSSTSSGLDIYSRKELYHHVKTVASYVVGTSRFPYIPEFIAGVWPWYLHPGEAMTRSS